MLFADLSIQPINDNNTDKMSHAFVWLSFVVWFFFFLLFFLLTALSPWFWLRRRRCFFPRTKLTSMSPMRWARITRTEKMPWIVCNVTQFAVAPIFTVNSGRKLNFLLIYLRLFFKLFSLNIVASKSNATEQLKKKTWAIAFEVMGGRLIHSRTPSN